MPFRRTAFLSAMLVTALLQAQSPLPPGTWHIEDASQQLHYAISRADLIVVSMSFHARVPARNTMARLFEAATASCDRKLSGSYTTDDVLRS